MAKKRKTLITAAAILFMAVAIWLVMAIMLTQPDDRRQAEAEEYPAASVITMEVNDKLQVVETSKQAETTGTKTGETAIEARDVAESVKAEAEATEEPTEEYVDAYAPAYEEAYVDSYTGSGYSGVTYEEGTLNPVSGVVQGPTGRETYYNLPMGGVVDNMSEYGYSQDDYWVRDDGVKMLDDYVMVAADLDNHPRGSVVETSLGDGIVCDTGYLDGDQIDVAVDW